MRFGCLGFIIALMLVVRASTLLYDDATLPKQVATTMAAFEQHPETSGWVKVTGAHLDLAGGIVTGTVSKNAKPDDGPTSVNNTLIPLRSAAVPADGSAVPAKLYLGIDDPELIDLLNRAIQGTDPLSDADRARLYSDEVRTVEGILEPASATYGADLLKKVDLKGDTAILRNAEEPRPWYIGAIILAGGASILGAIALQIAKVMRGA